MSKTPIFKCIYCWQSGLDSFFDDEHVLSRSLCGQGNNWTLKNQVCKTCNNRFSKFENELLQQSAETIARGFSGPLGRSAKSNSGKRIMTNLEVEIEAIVSTRHTDPNVRPRPTPLCHAVEGCREGACSVGQARPRCTGRRGRISAYG